MFLAHVTVLVLLMAAVLAVVAVFTVNRVHQQTSQKALNLARSVAAQPHVRESVAKLSENDELPLAQLRDGELQRTSLAAAQAASAYFVVVTDDRGMRLSHPDPQRIGEKVSTSPDVALSGGEELVTQSGTMGTSVRAKVPIWDPDESKVVGEISAGVSDADLADEIMSAITPVLGVGAIGLLFGVFADWALSRYLRRITRGLGPEEMSDLLADQFALLHGVDDGVVGIDSDGRATARNKSARDILGQDDHQPPVPAGEYLGQESSLVPQRSRALKAIDFPPEISDLVRGSTGPRESMGKFLINDRIVLVSVRPVDVDSPHLGKVMMLRDLTHVETLSRTLDSVSTMSDALRAQRHEFANKLHVLFGLLSIGHHAEAKEFIGEVTQMSSSSDAVENLTMVDDSSLAAFIEAKAVLASERGVNLRFSEDTLMMGTVVRLQEVTTVLGNLIDNAIRAATMAGESSEREHHDPGTVTLELLTNHDELHVVVTDNGPGVPDDLRESIFDVGVSAGARGIGYGDGMGLPLARKVARALGGDLWIADREHGAQGAVFCSRLPATVTREGGTDVE